MLLEFCHLQRIYTQTSSSSIRSHKWHLHKGFVRKQTSTARRAVHQRVAYPSKGRDRAQSQPELTQLLSHCLESKRTTAAVSNYQDLYPEGVDTQAGAWRRCRSAATSNCPASAPTIRVEWGKQQEGQCTVNNVCSFFVNNNLP